MMNQHSGGMPNSGMRMNMTQQQQQQMHMMQMQQQQQQQQRSGMMMNNMGQQSQMANVSQLQQRLQANRMQPGQMMNPNMQMGGRGIFMQGRPMTQNMAGPQRMGPMTMQGGPNNMGMMSGMGARGPPPMYQGSPVSAPNVNMMACSPAGNQFIPSPVSQAGMPSPAGGQRSMVPSPMSTANTPQNEPPGSVEEQQYLEKVSQLAKYIEPLKRMIARIGNEDESKLEKMKKLMDILSNPSKRMPMETLLKCEAVLARMNFDVDTTPETSTTAPAVNPLLEAIFNAKKSCKDSVQLNSMLQQTFSAPLDAVYGSEITLPPSKKVRCHDDDEDLEETASEVLQREVLRLRKTFKVTLDPTQAIGKGFRGKVNLICHLEDDNLPGVPPLPVTIPGNYPESKPSCDLSLSGDYAMTPFLERVAEAFISRQSKLPFRYTLTQLLNAWEMAVRAACSPRPVKLQGNTSLSSPIET